MSSGDFDKLLALRQRLFDSGFFKKLFVDKNELRFEICLNNYSTFKKKYEAGTLTEKESARLDVSNIDEKFNSTKQKYLEYINERFEQNQTNINYCEFLVRLKDFVEKQQVDAFNKAYFVFLIFETINNFSRKSNFFGYTDDWKEDMKQLAFFNCMKYIFNFDEDRVSKDNIASSAFSYVSQICNTSFITVLKEKKENSFSGDVEAYVNSEVNVRKINKVKVEFFIVEFDMPRFDFIINQLSETYNKIPLEINLYIAGCLSEVDNTLIARKHGKSINLLSIEQTKEKAVNYSYYFLEDGIFDCFGDKVDFSEYVIMTEHFGRQTGMFLQSAFGDKDMRASIEQNQRRGEFYAQLKKLYFWNHISLDQMYDVLALCVKGVPPLPTLTAPENKKYYQLWTPDNQIDEIEQDADKYANRGIIPEFEYLNAMVNFYKRTQEAHHYFLQIHSTYLRKFKSYNAEAFLKVWEQYKSRYKRNADRIGKYEQHLVNKLGNPIDTINIQEIVESLGNTDYEEVFDENEHLARGIQEERISIPYSEIAKLFEDFK